MINKVQSRTEVLSFAWGGKQTVDEINKLAGSIDERGTILLCYEEF